MSQELTQLDVTALREQLACGETTPEAIARAMLKRIAEVDPQVCAWEYIDEAAIERQLKKIAEYSSATHPLYGIPVGIKDIYNTFDMPTQMGSPLWKDFTPGNDARIVHYLRYNGALILGKTVTAEFAVHYQDKTRNPHDLTRSPGTSSSGSAVAVATNTVPVAFGSQTAGSIGRPASYCGIYGYKPTFGILPRIGVLKTTDSLDTLGFFTRSARDLKLILDASRVKGENYEYVHRYLDNYLPDPEPTYKVGIVHHPRWDLVEPSLKATFETFVKGLNDLSGMNIQTCPLPEDAGTIYALHTTIYDKALAYYFKEAYENHTLVSPIFYDIIQRGNTIASETYLDAIEHQAQMTREYHDYFEAYDILLTLTTADEAPVGLTTPDTPDSNLIWTFLGMPAVSIPLFKGRNGLPVGLLCVAKKYDDYRLLEFVEAIAKRYLNE